MRSSDLRFLRSPVWLAGHVLLLVTVVAFASFGFWQLRRLDEVRTQRELADGRLTAEPVELADAVAAADGFPDDLVYRRVEVTGRYRPDAQVVTQPRSRDGRPGNLLLTPLVPSSGGLDPVLVERGFVPYDREGVPPAAAEVPDGQVTVEGVLLPAEGEGVERVTNDAGLVTLVNPRALGDDLGVDLQPLPLRLLAQQPPQRGSLPLVGDLPELDEGNHLSYAVQWFAFAAIAAIGYPILVVRRARERAGLDADAETAARAGPAALPHEERRR